MLKQTLKNLCPDFILNFYIDYIREEIVRTSHRIKYSKEIKTAQTHYKSVEEKIRNRKDKPLRFAAYVVYDSSFSAYGLMDLMLADKSKYDAKVVIIPDVTRGDNNFHEQYKMTKDFFVKLYGSENVLDGYEENKKQFLDLSDQFDIIYLACPYNSMVNEVHGIKYLSTKNVLPIYISYGCMPDKYGCNEIIPLLDISLFWKVFADNKISFKDYKKYELLKGKNVTCTGYAKMDSLANAKEIPHVKKNVILAPHHTINNPGLPLSNFLSYYDFILELPVKYPELHFVFRPHPLLFVNMVNEKIWTKEQVEEYKQKLNDLGVTYSFGGNYFDVFANSDAIIHDCSSFVVEYLYTDKPCCFLAKSNYKKVFSRLGNSCLKHYYKAFNKDDIIHFIDEVVIKGNDSLKEKRIEFANQKIRLNYPDVCKEIMNEINL